MNTNHLRKFLAALLCGGLLAAVGVSSAEAGDGWRGGGRGWERGERHDRGYHRYGSRPVVVREKVIVRNYPRFYGGPAAYYAPPPPMIYGYSASPSVVIGINIPPLVIPLR